MSDKGLTRDKDYIIKMYNEGWHIIDIANQYGVDCRTIHRRLKKWGYEVKRRSGYRQRKSGYNMKAREFSPELKAKIAENTRINNAKIKYINFYNTTEDQILITNILSRPIIG